MSTPELPSRVDIYDTTLRDGSQREGLSLTVDDKLRIAEQLDHLGVHYIEGGWPGANPKDIEFFARAKSELDLATSTLVAFGSTRRPRGKVDSDETLRNLVEASTSAVCIVAKSSAYHVTEALQTTLDEGEAMIADSVRYLNAQGRLVLVDDGCLGLLQEAVSESGLDPAVAAQRLHQHPVQVGRKADDLHFAGAGE